MAVPVTRSNDQGFGNRNRSNPAPPRTNYPYASYLPSLPPSRSHTPDGPVAGRALAIYCPHSAGSQHKYVTPMATPTAHGSRIPPQPSGRTAKRITADKRINAPLRPVFTPAVCAFHAFFFPLFKRFSLTCFEICFVVRFFCFLIYIVYMYIYMYISFDRREMIFFKRRYSENNVHVLCTHFCS